MRAVFRKEILKVHNQPGWRIFFSISAFFWQSYCSFLGSSARNNAIRILFWPLHAESIVRYPEDDHHVPLFFRELEPEKLHENTNWNHMLIILKRTFMWTVKRFQQKKISKMIAQKRDKLWNLLHYSAPFAVREKQVFP